MDRDLLAEAPLRAVRVLSTVLRTQTTAAPASATARIGGTAALTTVARVALTRRGNPLRGAQGVSCTLAAPAMGASGLSCRCRSVSLPFSPLRNPSTSFFAQQMRQRGRRPTVDGPGKHGPLRRIVPEQRQALSSRNENLRPRRPPWMGRLTNSLWHKVHSEVAWLLNSPK